MQTQVSFVPKGEIDVYDRGFLIVIKTIEAAAVLACLDGVAVVGFHPLLAIRSI